MDSPNRQRRPKKKKKTKIEISLYVNGISYIFGKNCTFCEKNRAVFHCPDCQDFYCESCDTTAHSHKKRKHHVRAKLSLYDIPTASRICTHAVIFFYYLRMLQRLAREKIKRYFDPATLCHYYYNTVDGTVSWRKPYCLRREELFPFLTPDQAAARMQGLHRMWKARQRVIKEILTQYSKIFDRSRARFYFAYIGKSSLVSKQSWYPPILLKKRGIYGMIPILFTPDVAALIIQRKWRAILIHEFIKAILRKTYERQWDPIRGDWKYVHQDTGEELLYKPLCLRGDHWDPNEIPNWSVAEVCLFMRRLGYKEYVPHLLKYRVDGRTLLLLDTQDYPSINITTRLHIRKIQVEIDKRWPSWKREEITSLHLVRREKLRRQGELEAAAIEIQRVYRGHLGRIDVKNLYEVKRVLASKKNYDVNAENGKIWWLEKINKPNYDPNTIITSKRNVLITNKQNLQSTKLTASALATTTPSTPSKPSTPSTNQINNSDLDIPFPIGAIPPPPFPSYPLPPLKVFGRKRTYLSCKGWGGYNTNIHGKDEWKPLQIILPELSASASGTTITKTTAVAATTANGIYRDTNVTTYYTEKLTKSGYDRHREEVRSQHQILRFKKKEQGIIKKSIDELALSS